MTVSQTIPVDPTVSDPSPAELLAALPSDSAFKRVLASIGIEPTRAERGTREHVVAELSEVDRVRAAAQVRFAGPGTFHFYGVPTLGRLATSDLGSRVDADAFGPQLRAVEEHHDRVYAVCSVPEGGTQAQLSVAEEQRETTVATFDPGSELLTVRASGAEVADATFRVVLSDTEQEPADRLPLWEDSVRGLFDDACLSSYSGLVFSPTRDGAATDRIDITAKDAEDGSPRDLREDTVVQDLIGNGSVALSAGRGLLDSATITPAIADEPPVGCTIDFVEGHLTLERFEPEAVLIALERATESIL